MLDFITGIIGTILYPLFSIVFLIIDALQGVFRSFAGVEDIGISSGRIFGNYDTISGSNPELYGTEKGTGIVFYFLNTPLVKNMLISIAVLAIFLLIIFTVMAFIRNAYSDKQKNWKEIISNSIKGLASFVIIPVGCLLGIWAGNILLIAIDGATSNNGATSLGRKLFITCAYNANEFRSDKTLRPDDYYDFAKLYNEYVDNIFTMEADDKADLNKKENIKKQVEAKFGSGDAGREAIATEIDNIYAGNVTKTTTDKKTGKEILDPPGIYWHWQVSGCYELYRINYIVLIVGGVFMMYVMINLTYGMIRRLILLVMLYIVSPAVCAMYPLDEGKAVGQWKSKFFQETVSAYAAVAGLNIFFSIIPLITSIEVLNKQPGAFLLNNIIQLILLTAGLFVVKDFISTVAGFYGGGDAYSQGMSLRSTATKSMKDKAKEAGKKTGAFVGGTERLVNKGANFISSERDRRFANKGKEKDQRIGFFEWKNDTTANEREEVHKNRLEHREEEKRTLRVEGDAINRYEKLHGRGSFERLSADKQDEIKNRAWETNSATTRLWANKILKMNFEDYDKLSDEDKMDIERQRMQRRKDNSGLGANTAAGKAIRGAGKALGKVGQSALGDIWKEAELGYKEAYDDANAAEGKKAAAAKKGEMNEKEALERIKALKLDDVGVTIKGATSEALTAMSNNLFRDKVFSDATKGKVEGFDFGSIGLNAKSATIEDVQNLDRIITSNITQAERMQSAAAAGNTDLARELATNLLDKLSNLDTGGNAKLEEAVRNAMNSLSEIKTKTELDPAQVKALAENIGKSFNPLNEASTKNAKAIQKYIEKAAEDIVKALKNEQRRSGGKK